METHSVAALSHPDEDNVPSVKDHYVLFYEIFLGEVGHSRSYFKEIFKWSIF